jgi:hypothetical protein
MGRVMSRSSSTAFSRLLHRRSTSSTIELAGSTTLRQVRAR